MRARVRTDDSEHSERFDVTQRLRDGCVLLSNVFFGAALRVVLVRFSKDEAIARVLVRLNDAGVVGTEEQEPLACVRRALWGILYADVAGNVLKSAEGLAEMMTVIVTVFEAAGFTVSEKETEPMLLRTSDQTTLAPLLVIEEADQRYKQTAQFFYLGDIIHENADLSLDIDRRIRLLRACFKRLIRRPWGISSHRRTSGTVPLGAWS